MGSTQFSSWSIIWGLIPLAFNIMVQPSGRVCGFAASLRTYLRSSPIICAADAIGSLTSIFVYMIRNKLSFSRAIRQTLLRKMAVLGKTPIKSNNKAEQLKLQEEGSIDLDIAADNGRISSRITILNGLKSVEDFTFVRILFFIVPALIQYIKFVACSGLPWTLLWASLYFWPFIIMEIMLMFSGLCKEDNSELDSTSNHTDLNGSSKIGKEGTIIDDKWLGFIDQFLGVFAIILQFAVLGWVDLALVPLDKSPLRCWSFRGFRFLGHLSVYFVHYPLQVLASAVDIDCKTSIKDMKHAVKGAVASQLVLFGIFIFWVHGTGRYTLMYYLYSALISTIAWLLYVFKPTRRHILLCDEDTEGMKAEERYRGSCLGIRPEHWNVLSFDLYCKIVWLSVFWYLCGYDPVGTRKPDWVGYLG
ncbi:hypothetical protein TWF694_002322 [Orbilia ellipsospora]|uniref:Uncharacterized protein n=1 Tax=Orbilia ellipsospora TaxID=2528407 RepID=A0AAV9X2W7_9PEZI